MKGHRLIIGCVVLALVVLAPQTLLAQSNASKGQIFGTATDPEGSVMPGVTVEAKNTDSGFSRSAVSDASGFYRMDLMPVGNYEVQSHSPGLPDPDLPRCLCRSRLIVADGLRHGPLRRRGGDRGHGRSPGGGNHQPQRIRLGQ